MAEAIIPVSIPKTFNGTFALIEPQAISWPERYAVAKTLVSVRSFPDCRLRRSYCRVLSVMPQPCKIHRGTVLATIHNMSAISNIANVSNKIDEYRNEVTLDRKLQKLKELGLQVDRTHMDDESYEKLCNLLFEFSDVFATKLSDLTGSNIIKCHIETKGHPFRIRPYRLSPEMKKEVDKQLDEMLSAGIISESDNSPWASPIVMAKKSNGEWRFCADMRRLNLQCEPLYHELPSLDDVVDLVSQSQSKVFTVCDLKSAFYQLNVDEESATKTTFVTPHRGSFKFLRTPMGYRNSPYFCTQALNKLFRHQIGSFMLVYIDDLLLASPDVDSHLEHLRIVFSKLRQSNLKLHPSKSQFMLRELKYLGHIFNAEGIRVDPKRSAVVKDYPRPKNQKEVRMFLGLCNYFRKSILHYADKTHALTKLLRKDVSFTWDDEQEESFRVLKDALTNAPVMAIPDASQPYYLTCDASDTSVSFNLSQIIDKVERVIEYGARGLRKSELNYTISEKEILAVVCGVQHYHEYLSGKKFKIRTDHQCLKYLSTMKHCTGRLARWNLLLSGYDYDIEYTRGRDNTAADALSRITLPAPEQGPELELDHLLLNIDSTIFQSKDQVTAKKPRLREIVIDGREKARINAIDDHGGDVQNEPQVIEVDLTQHYDVSAEQERCPDCVDLIRYIRDGLLPTNDDTLARKIVMQADNCAYENGILYHLHMTRRKRLDQVDPVLKQLVVPRSLREQVLKAYHDQNSHVGTDKLYSTIQTKFYWPNMYADTHLWTKSCFACQSGKPLR